MRAVLATLQEPKVENHPNTKALQEEVRDLRAMVATLQKNYSSNSPQEHTETDKNFKDTSWSEVVRREQKSKSKGGLRRKGNAR